MITIRLRRDGPYVIESDDVRIVDADGNECVADRRPIALCRCGRSLRKPFCDGTHRLSGVEGSTEQTAAGKQPNEKG